MKVVVQRVSKAKVTNVHKNEVVGEIDKGMFVLVGIQKGDTPDTILKMSSKLKKLRIFEETEGKMTHSLFDLHYPILVVSQFTLLANTKDGNRPSFLDAEEPAKARELYEVFVEDLGKDLSVQTGNFGEYMKIDCTLDGPVTIVVNL